jgi:hypothetical protein
VIKNCSLCTISSYVLKDIVDGENTIEFDNDGNVMIQVSDAIQKSFKIEAKFDKS